MILYDDGRRIKEDFLTIAELRIQPSTFKDTFRMTRAEKIEITSLNNPPDPGLEKTSRSRHIQAVKRY